MATPSHRRLYSYVHLENTTRYVRYRFSRLQSHAQPVGSSSHISSPPPSRPPSIPVPPLPPSLSTMSRPRLYPYYEPMSKLSSSMVDLSSRSRRCPSTDPRRARRQGTDFGFSRSTVDLPPLLVPPSTEFLVENPCSPTSCSVYSSIESDSEASSVQDIQLDFPEPPPISPVLRRMKSSQLFTMDDVTIAQLGERGFQTALTAMSPDPIEIQSTDDVLSDILTDSTLSPITDTMSTDSPDSISQELDLDRQSILESANWLYQPPGPPSRLSGNVSPNNYRSKIHPSPSHSARPFTSPSIIYPPLSRHVPRMRSLKFSASKIERSDVLTEKPKIPKSTGHARSASADFQNPCSTGFFGSSSDMAVDLPRNIRIHDVQPPNKFVQTHQRSISMMTPVGLTKPSTPLDHSVKNTHYREEFKSFMDISPERGTSRLGTRKDTVKKLLTRAGTLFDWKRHSKSGK
ncbi:hypothetical protein L218DRAFT_958691 [Marasmius fiardii PR-910]|nr:hypothetical protein L218DRAFT_958691 [Marasmius fiardii PR-910]